MGNLISALDEYALGDPATLDRAGLATEIRELVIARRRVEAELVRRVRAFDVRRLAQVEGAASTTAWLGRETRMGPGEAALLVRTGRRLPELPALAEAFNSGEIGVEHLRAVDSLAKNTDEATVATHDALLAATAVVVRPNDLARLAQRIAVHADTDGRLSARISDRRHVDLSQTFDGLWHLSGLLEPETGALLSAAIASTMTPTGPEDTRTAGQRRHDAVGDIASAFLGSGNAGTSGGVKPHVDLVIPLAQLLDHAGIAENEWVGPLDSATARQLACDAELSRAITDAHGAILDYGRSHRIVPTALRRFLDLRDAGCVFPGCTRPPAWTDAHHLVPWVDGGETSPANTCLLCRFHHRLVHRAWSLTPLPDNRWRATDGRLTLETQRPP